MTNVTRNYVRCKFRVEDIRQALSAFRKVMAVGSEWLPAEGIFDASVVMADDGLFVESVDRKIERGNDSWSYESDAEFFNDYRESVRHANYGISIQCRPPGGVDMSWSERARLRVSFYSAFNETSVTVTGVSRAEALQVLQVFDAAVQAVQVPPPSPPVPPVPPPLRVFIGHGGTSSDWQTLLIDLQSKHGIKATAFETGARAGHTIRDVLSDELEESSFALLVLTAEDEQADGQLRARQNVIHEAGLFQGRLGFGRAILLIESGVEDFSNDFGTQYISFERGKIGAVVGDVIATLRREKLL